MASREHGKKIPSLDTAGQPIQVNPVLMKAQLLLASKIELLTNDLNSWMSSNRLSLNSAKTQLIWFGTPQQLLKLDHALLSDRFPHFTFQTTVRDLGVTLDSA